MNHSNIVIKSTSNIVMNSTSNNNSAAALLSPRQADGTETGKGVSLAHLATCWAGCTFSSHV